MTDAVKKVLEENVWSIATMSDVPNVVPVGFKFVLEDGRLVVANVMMDTTVRNVQANGLVSVSAYSAASEGYQVRGKAVYETEGACAELCRKAAEERTGGAMVIQGAVVITPEEIIVTTPGPDNKKVMKP